MQFIGICPICLTTTFCLSASVILLSFRNNVGHKSDSVAMPPPVLKSIDTSNLSKEYSMEINKKTVT